MKHPNTVAALVALGISAGIQALLQRYGHVALTDYWSKTIDAAVTAVVLYVGKAGVKAALRRVWNGPKAAWTGQTPTARSK